MSKKHRKRIRFRKHNPPPGSQPGTLAVNSEMPKPVLRVIEYGPDHFHEREVIDPADLRGLTGDEGKFWVDIQGLGSEQVLKVIGEIFSIHPLALADVVNVPQRPKVELFEEHNFVVTRMGKPEPPASFSTEQVSLFVGRNYVITFQERSGDVLDPVRNRLRKGGGAMRASGPDYLAYAIWDAIIDGYYPILEVLGEYIEQLEVRTAESIGPDVVREIQVFKHELLDLRRAIWPQRDAINSMIRDPSPLIGSETRLHLRDCYDHCVQIIDVLETYREMVWGLMDVHLASVSNRQNEVVKVLTLVATIFIPLTFLAGVYGMNFEYMPELGWHWAYFTVLAGMLGIAGGMLLVFYKRGWLGSRQSTPRHEEMNPRR